MDVHSKVAVMVMRGRSAWIKLLENSFSGSFSTKESLMECLEIHSHLVTLLDPRFFPKSHMIGRREVSGFHERARGGGGRERDGRERPYERTRAPGDGGNDDANDDVNDARHGGRGSGGRPQQPHAGRPQRSLAARACWKRRGSSRLHLRERYRERRGYRQRERLHGVLWGIPSRPPHAACVPGRVCEAPQGSRVPWTRTLPCPATPELQRLSYEYRGCGTVVPLKWNT